MSTAIGGSTTGATAHAQRRSAAWSAGLAASALIVATVVGVAFQRSERPEHVRLPFDPTFLELVAAIALIAAIWAAAIRSQEAALGMLVFTVGAALPVWAAWSTLPPLARAAAAVTAPFAIAGTAQLGIGWSRHPRSHRVSALVPVYALATLAAVTQLALLDPLTELECRRTCMAIALPSTGLLGARATIWLVAVLATAATIAAAAAVLHDRRAHPPEVLTAGALATMLLFAGSAVLRAAAWTDGRLADIALVLIPIAALTLACVVLVEALRTRLARESITRALTSLSSPVAGTRHRGDPRALRAVEFAVPGTDRWVDANGAPPARAADSTSYRVVTTQVGEPVARLAVTPRTESAEVVAALTPAVRLDLRNAQLAAATRARLADTQASRRRIVESADTEARRIERDLHDGAQQRLVSAALYLSIAKASLPSPVASDVLAAEVSIRAALAQLRRLARGFVPATLASDGLAAAIDDAARETGVPVTLNIDLHGAETDRSAALAAFAVARAGLDAAARLGTDIQVFATIVDGTLLVRVDVRGGAPAPADLVSVTDRVGALGGELLVKSAPDSTTVEAVIPCVSSLQMT